MRTARLILLAVSVALAHVSADVLVTRGITYTGQVVKVTTAGIAIKVGENEFTVPRSEVLSADVLKPETFEKSLTALRAGKNQEASTGFKSVADRYAGLPLPWAEESLVRLGDAQVAMKDYVGARKSFDSFRAWYPQSPLVKTLEIKNARILFEQGQADQAMSIVQGVLGSLLKRDYLTDEQEASVAEGLVLQGDSLVVAGKLDDALDNYLKVVALFDVDADRTAEAKYKAGKLFEQHGNWRRAKQNYDELLKETPNEPFAENAKKRLADLTHAHPE